MVDIQVRCTLRSANGVEADNAVNTFAVLGAVPGSDDAAILDAFSEFYNQVPLAGLDTVGRFINDTMLRTDGLRIELISTPQTPPNAPYAMEVFDLPPVGSGIPLVQEAAVCLSMVTEGYLTSPTPGRHRGRVYIGPLCAPASVDGGTLDVLRPSQGIMESLASAAAGLKITLEVGGREWALWSRAANAFSGIQGGWVDNEFDTQRRRGRPRTSRIFW